MKHYLAGLLIGAMAIPLVAKAVDDIAQTPLFVTDSVPPLNMLVMGRDHKLYYEAYNDASDLNGDGVLDIGYKGYRSSGGIDYYGYFNSKLCYSYTNDRFVPVAAGTGATGKECSNQWSGDFLNYLATSRMDALRKVLYGGYRGVDDSGTTVLQGAYIPEDSHTWGKEYTSLLVDGYDISHFAPLEAPLPGYRHLIAVTSLSDNGIPQLRVLTNVNLRIWNWVSIERPVGRDECVNAKGARRNCLDSGPKDGWALVPPSSFTDLTITTWAKSDSNHPDSTSAMDELFRTNATNNRLCGSQDLSTGIYSYGADNNPFNGVRTPGGLICGNDRYLTEIRGRLRVETTGTYKFAVDGDDAVDVKIANNSLPIASWYGGHGALDAGSNNHSGTFYLQAGVEYDILFRQEEGEGGDAWGLYWQPPDRVQAASLANYNIQVEVCPNDVGSTSKASLRESNCKRYPHGDYKPTGILHDYGETNKMYFGLLSGSYKNHFYGGVLRSNIQSFARELNSDTGQFCLNGNCNGEQNNVQGIVDTINRFRTVGFNYADYMYNCGFGNNPARNLASDACYMWGTPTAEMMYETLRYFAGASGPTSAFDYSREDSGVPDNQLGLAHPTWIAPYSRDNGGAGYPLCSVPAMTVLSDIYPNYDWKLPGNPWGASVSNSNDPEPLNNLNVATETDAIGAAENLNGTTVFIGETTANADSAPTQKTLPTLSEIRGLAPEEPGKQGTYYSAGIARFAARNHFGGGSKNMITYAVALASPFPKIEFPVGQNKITLVPFAKSVVEDPNGNQYQATNQLADFYVQKLANTTTANADSTVNEGRPYAEFRINWEDSEEGADFDMDAIVLYTLAVVPDPADGDRLKLRITLNSEYAAGSNKQHMGYTISGTDHDGLYLEVCDLADGRVNNGQRNVCDGQTRYRLNTPPNRPAGWCINNLSSDECRGLPPTATRTFTATGVGAGVLKDPLWYAAKYGTPDNNWDTNNDGVPDNYLLVTNALTLKDQLNKAFSNVIQRNSSITRVAVETNRNEQGSQTGRTVYRTTFNADDWTGNLVKETYTNGSSAPLVLNASIPSSGRIVKMAGGAGADRLQDFTYDNLRGRTFGGQDLQTLMNQNPAGNSDGLGADRVSFLLGTCTSTACANNFRTRSSLLGDIVNSSPVLVGAPNYLAYRVDPVDGSSGSYAAFQTAQASRREQVYVGANDGMLHAFDAATLEERFAFVPTPVIPKLNRLMARDYGATTSHQYYVDGRLATADVYFDGEWHTVLVGTLGGGGRGLFALDITDPDRIKLLWEFTSDSAATLDEATQHSNLGYNFGPPTIARLHTGDWAAVFGNGYYSDNADSGKAILYAIKISDGTLIKAVEATSPATGSNGLSAVQVADYNGDVVADAAYAGDLLGNLWRFDLTSRNTTAPFTRSTDGADQANSFAVAFGGTPLYRARTSDQETGRPQAITAAPVLIQHPTLKGYLVTFATGRYLNVNDKGPSFDIQTVYGIWDRWTLGEETSASLVSGHNRASLQQQTITSATYSSGNVTRNVRTFSANAVSWYRAGTTSNGDTDVDRWGWYTDLKTVGTSTNTGERVIFPLKSLGDTLVFTSITPNADPCSAGIDSTLYGIDGKTGGRTLHHVFDLNHDGQIDVGDSVVGDTVVSGIEGTIGDNTLAGDQALGSDGSVTGLSSGPNATGRQSWRLLPPPAP